MGVKAREKVKGSWVMGVYKYTGKSGTVYFRVLEACQPHLRPIVLCALETGMRKAGILGLRWREIRDGQIYLGGDRTKNGKPREIPVSDRLANELSRMKAVQGGERVVPYSVT